VNDTSSINNTELQGFSTRDQVHKALARIFSHAGMNTLTGGFLHNCGIKCWADLDKPILVPSRNRDVPFEMNVAERPMRLPGPNPCHPEAVFGQYAAIQFDADLLRWSFRVNYGYSRDCSSWLVSIHQEAKESLHHFGQRIPGFIDSLFQPENKWAARDRAYKNRQYLRAFHAIDDLFYSEWWKMGYDLAEAIMETPETGGTRDRHIVLTKSRCRTVKRWIRNHKSAEYPWP